MGARTQHLSCAFCTGESTNHTMWRMAVCDTSDKIESLLQKSELGRTLGNIVPQLARRKFVASQVERTGGNTNNNTLQLAIRQNQYYTTSKMFLWVVCFLPKKSEMALPVTSGFPQGNCYCVSINDLAAIIEDSLLSQYSDGAVNCYFLK